MLKSGQSHLERTIALDDYSQVFRSEKLEFSQELELFILPSIGTFAQCCQHQIRLLYTAVYYLSESYNKPIPENFDI